MPIAFTERQILPNEYEIPPEFRYEYMIHNLMTEYKIDREKAGKMTEYDCVKMIAFKNIEIEKQNFVNDNIQSK